MKKEIKFYSGKHKTIAINEENQFLEYSKPLSKVEKFDNNITAQAFERNAAKIHRFIKRNTIIDEFGNYAHYDKKTYFAIAPGSFLGEVFNDMNKKINESYEIREKNIDIEKELSQIKSKWWYKLFNWRNKK